jgi:hypothetical protein
MKLFQMILAGAGVFAPATMTIGGAKPADPGAETAPSTFMARLTLPNGASRLVELEGVGCTQSICSRTHISGRTEHQASAAILFRAIHEIQSAAPNTALLMLNDGTQQQMSLITDFRVLYFRYESGEPHRLDLAEVESLEFLPGQ